MTAAATRREPERGARHAAPGPSWRPVDLAAAGLGLVRLVAAGWLMVLAAMLVCLPVARIAGWQAAAVVGGSMAPAIAPGDVVLADPAAVRAVRPGQIVLTRPPAGGLLTHRVVQVRPDGTLVTRGDANAVDDSRPLSRGAVVGVVRLVVPQVARPLLLPGRHEVGDLSWTVLLVAAVGLVTVRRDRPTRPPRR